LPGQLKRLQDLYVLADLPKAQYVMRRQAIEEKAQPLGAQDDPGIDRAKGLLGDFSTFWELETEPAERRAAARLAVRAGLGAGRADRRRAAARGLPAVLPSRQPLPHWARRRTWSQKRERRDSNPRLSPRRSRYGYSLVAGS
jgi:hypothetical protein